jgi:hypothetical protein
MLALRTEFRLDVLDHGARQSAEGVYSVDAFAEPAAIRALETSGRYKVELHEDVDALGKQRQAEVGRGNRFLDRKRQ